MKWAIAKKSIYTGKAYQYLRSRARGRTATGNKVESKPQPCRYQQVLEMRFFLIVTRLAVVYQVRCSLWCEIDLLRTRLP